MERRLYHGMLGLMLVALAWDGFHLYLAGIHGLPGAAPYLNGFRLPRSGIWNFW